MPGTTNPALAIRALVLTLVGCALAWFVITYTYVAYLAEKDPLAAIKIRRDSTALFNHVERRLDVLMSETRAIASEPRRPALEASPNDGAPALDRLRAWAGLATKAAQPAMVGRRPEAEIAEERKSLRAMVREALIKDPLSARGFRMLAQIEEGEGAPKEDVAKLMHIAASRSVHETQAIWWLMLHAIEQKDNAAIISYADKVLRTNSRMAGPAIEALNKASENEGGVELVIESLKARPPWRSGFLASWPQYVRDARVPLKVFLALRDTPDPPTNAELRGFMQVLMQNKLYPLAYYVWLQFLPADELKNVTSVFNGGFERAPSGLPFDWSLGKGPGVVAAIVPRPGEASNRALSIEFGVGRVEFPGVTQVVLLPSGTYRFEASYRAQILGRRGLVWQVTCLNEARTVLGATAMMVGTVATWKPITFDFKVPDTGCAAQELKLYHDARSASEQLVTGWSLQDDVTITRLEGP